MKIIILCLIVWFIYVGFNIIEFFKIAIKNEELKEKKREKNKKNKEKKNKKTQE